MTPNEQLQYLAERINKQVWAMPRNEIIRGRLVSICRIDNDLEGPLWYGAIYNGKPFKMTVPYYWVLDSEADAAKALEEQREYERKRMTEQA